MTILSILTLGRHYQIQRWEGGNHFSKHQNVHDDSGGRTPGRKIRDKAIAAPWMEAQMGNGLQG